MRAATETSKGAGAKRPAKAAPRRAAKKPPAKRAKAAATPEPAKKVVAEKRAAKGGSGDALARLRKICLALPETSEKEAWGTPTFRVRGKMFAMFADDHHGDGRVAVWCKAPLGAQEALVEADPDRFFRPPYVGPSGWVGVRLDRGVAWDEIADILDEGWRAAAPKKLAATRGNRGA
jgi:hypothetical protein